MKITPKPTMELLLSNGMWHKTKQNPAVGTHGVFYTYSGRVEARVVAKSVYYRPEPYYVDDLEIEAQAIEDAEIASLGHEYEGRA